MAQKAVGSSPIIRPMECRTRHRLGVFYIFTTDRYNICMIIDLSVALNQKTPAYPGDPHIVMKQSDTIESDGYLGHSVELGTHTGTHIDAPAHMIQDGPSLGEIPLQTFIGQGKVVYGTDIQAIKAAGIIAGDIVLFDTNTASRYYEASYFSDYPVLDQDSVEYLIETDVRMIGLDTCSADIVDGFPNHKALLSAGIPILENLTNLTELHGKTFQVIALPLKLNLDGAPARVIAVTGDE